jgi:hypothetical protein
VPISEVRPRQPHDVSLACGSQPAHEKLLNRRIRAGALTTAPSFVCRYPRDHRADQCRSTMALQSVIRIFETMTNGIQC